MALSQYDWCLCKKRIFGYAARDQGWAGTEERPCEDRMRKWLSASQGERAQGKPNQPPEWRENECSLFKPPTLCYY